MPTIVKTKLPAPRVELCRSRNKQFFCRYIARNGKEIARSSETYTRSVNALKAFTNMAGKIAFFEAKVTNLTLKK